MTEPAESPRNAVGRRRHGPRETGVPVQAYLAFERLGTHREKFGLALEEITPAAFKAAGG